VCSSDLACCVDGTFWTAPLLLLLEEELLLLLELLLPPPPPLHEAKNDATPNASTAIKTYNPIFFIRSSLVLFSSMC
jgi:hypothetical protein